MNNPMNKERELNPKVDGATVFEIEHDIFEATGVRPSSGAVHSALGTLRKREHVRREDFNITEKPTYTHFLTEQGVERLNWFIVSAVKIKEFKPIERRGRRVSPRASPLLFHFDSSWFYCPGFSDH